VLTYGAPAPRSAPSTRPWSRQRASTLKGVTRTVRRRPHSGQNLGGSSSRRHAPPQETLPHPVQCATASQHL